MLPWKMLEPGSASFLCHLPTNKSSIHNQTLGSNSLLDPSMQTYIYAGVWCVMECCDEQPLPLRVVTSLGPWELHGSGSSTNFDFIPPHHIQTSRISLMLCVWLEQAIAIYELTSMWWVVCNREKGDNHCLYH